MLSASPDIAATLGAARKALEAGDLNRCAQLANAAMQSSPRSAQARFLFAMALAEGGRVTAALQTIEQAIALEASNAEYLAHQARLLTLVRREADARIAADTAASLGSDDPMVLDTIGCVYARLSDHDAALPLFEAAVAGQPDGINYRFNLATSYGFFGRIDEAEAQYEAMLSLDPGNGRAHLGIAALRRQTSERNHVARLDAALGQTDDPVQQLRIHYAAAKEYEDLGDHEAVFGHLSAGNSAHKRRLGFTIDSESRNFHAIRTCFAKPGYFSGGSGVTDAPIFVVGMPRTGTTLVDRILSSHPQVQSAGELQAMPLAIKRLAQTASRLVLDPETVLAAGDLDPGAVGRAYMQRARQHAGADGPVFVDKFPLNFLYIGYIARALPQAKIVCLRRHPMDSVWSNYKNLFATGSPYYGWSYDLMDTARYFALFDELMTFWHDLFPGRVLELGYEALIADQEGETRRLLAHCGLEWDEACLRFQDNAAAVATPSAQQVRRSLNADSVQKWRAYEAHLAPVKRFFTDQGIAVE